MSSKQKEIVEILERSNEYLAEAVGHNDLAAVVFLVELSQANTQRVLMSFYEFLDKEL